MDTIDVVQEYRSLEKLLTSMINEGAVGSQKATLDYAQIGQVSILFLNCCQTA